MPEIHTESHRDELGGVEDQIVSVLDPIRRRFCAVVLAMEGNKEETFEANKAIAIRIQKIADRLGVLFRCPKEGCGLPAKIRCRNTTGSKAGSFQFEHFIKGRKVNHGGRASLPRLEIVEQPNTAEFTA